MKENAPYAYHGVGGLIELARRKDEKLEAARISWWNVDRTLVQRNRALAEHKKLMVAIAHHDVPRLRVLVATALRHGASARAICGLVEDAAMGLYHAKGYDEKDELVGYLMGVIGGPRNVRLGQAVFGGPSLSTIRRHRVAEPLLVSPSVPTIEEVLHNICVCFPNSGPLEYDAASEELQCILMFDEMGCEGRLRYDPKTGMIVGLCREHSVSSALEFNSMEDLNMVGVELKDGKIHRACEVCRPLRTSSCISDPFCARLLLQL